MANIGYLKINKSDEYIDLENELGFDFVEGETYHIQIQGACMISEALEKPLSGMVFWNILKPFDFLKGTSKLWIQVQSPVANISVWDDKAEEPKPEPEWYNLMGFSLSERGMVMSIKPYTSEWQPLEDMTELQAYMADSGGKFSGAGYAYKSPDDLTFDKAFVGNDIGGLEPEYLDGEASLWIVVTENNEKTKILFTDATATFSEDFMTMNWSYGTYAGTFTYDMSDMNKPLLECIHVIHNGQACENAELMVKFISASEPTKKTVWFPIEVFDSFTEETDVEGYDYYYDINAVATDGEDSYNIYYEQGVLPEVEYVSGVKFNNLRVSKNGSPVNASLYIRVQPDGSQDFLDFPIEDLTIEATSEYDCSWYSGSERFSKDSYNGTFVIEENADEEGHYGYVGGEVVKQKGEGEAEHIADSCTLYVKVTY